MQFTLKLYPLSGIPIVSVAFSSVFWIAVVTFQSSAFAPNYQEIIYDEVMRATGIKSFQLLKMRRKTSQISKQMAIPCFKLMEKCEGLNY